MAKKRYRLRNTLSAMVGVASLAAPVAAAVDLFADAANLEDSTTAFNETAVAYNEAFDSIERNPKIVLREDGKISVWFQSTDRVNLEKLNTKSITDTTNSLTEIKKELERLEELLVGGAAGLVVSRLLRKKDGSSAQQALSAERRNALFSICLEQRLSFAILLLASASTTGILWNASVEQDFDAIKNIDMTEVAQSSASIEMALSDLDIEISQHPKSETLHATLRPNVPAFERLQESAQNLSAQDPQLTDLSLAADKVFLSFIPFMVISAGATIANGYGLMTGRNRQTREYMGKIANIQSRVFGR